MDLSTDYSIIRAIAYRHLSGAGAAVNDFGWISPDGFAVDFIIAREGGEVELVSIADAFFPNAGDFNLDKARADGSSVLKAFKPFAGAGANLSFSAFFIVTEPVMSIHYERGIARLAAGSF